MNFQYICDKEGQNVILRSNSWNSRIYNAIVFMTDGKLLYIGDVKHDLTKLDENYWLEMKYKKYALKDKNKVMCGDTPILITARLEEIK